MMDDVSLDAMLAIQQCLANRPDSVPMLTSIDVPVCVLAGGEDASSTPPEMQVIADRVPQAEFHLLPDAGHYAPLEQPEVVADILERFFLRADAAGPAPKGGV
jgi:3-oxoadipate enol-lactonase